MVNELLDELRVVELSVSYFKAACTCDELINSRVSYDIIRVQLVLRELYSK